MDTSETTRLRALLERTATRVLTVAEERDAATKRAERAERERDDLAATLEARTAEHVLAMERAVEMEAAARLKGVAEGAALMHTVISGAVLSLATDDGLAMVLGALDAHREGRAVTLRMDLAADDAEVSR